MSGTKDMQLTKDDRQADSLKYQKNEPKGSEVVALRPGSSPAEDTILMECSQETTTQKEDKCNGSQSTTIELS